MAAIGVMALVIALLAAGGTSPPAGPAGDEEGLVGKPVAYRYAVLSHAQSNRCDLSAAGLRRMRDGMRLRGSCCFPMDRARYAEQLRGLRRYASTGVVPADPYDVSVALAKRLLRYREIKLSRQGEATYRRATEISELGGPCCCPCWRWQAFEGQARFLIAREGYSARQLADLWETEEGCGGPKGS